MDLIGNHIRSPRRQGLTGFRQGLGFRVDLEPQLSNNFTWRSPLNLKQDPTHYVPDDPHRLMLRGFRLAEGMV